MKLQQLERRLCAAVRIALTAGILIGPWSGCKSPTSPNGKGEADIIVISDVEDAMDIYMDGVFMFEIKYKEKIEIDNVTLAEHEMEAKAKGTDTVIESGTVDVVEESDYSWTVDDPPDIYVTNNCKFPVRVSMDGGHQFDLERNDGRWIIDVAYGDRFLKAWSAEDGREVASKTIAIEENQDYSWTIAEIE
jgi:hypothetical protein